MVQTDQGIIYTRKMTHMTVVVVRTFFQPVIFEVYMHTGRRMDMLSRRPKSNPNILHEITIPHKLCVTNISVCYIN